MRARAVVLAVAIVLAPLGARAADLVVWWDKGLYPQEDEALREIIAAFEQKTGKQVELVFHPQTELPDKLVAALEAGRPPDFAFGIGLTPISRDGPSRIGWWISRTPSGPSRTCSIPTARPVHAAQRQDRAEGAVRAADGRMTNHVHVWKSLLERAGFTLADIPKEWEAFWSFWCDQVQPAVRRATGRDDIWGIGLPMSAEARRHRRRVLPVRRCLRGGLRDPRRQAGHRRPGGQARLIKAMDSYTADLSQGLHAARLR